MADFDPAKARELSREARTAFKSSLIRPYELMSMADQLDAACDAVDILKKQRDAHHNSAYQLSDRLNESERLLDMAREVLAFYESEQNWQANDLGMSAIGKDCGKRARKALRKLNLSQHETR